MPLHVAAADGSGADAYLALRRLAARGKTTVWACFDKHCTNPELCPRGVRKTKRARQQAEAEGSEDDEL